MVCLPVQWVPCTLQGACLPAGCVILSERLSHPSIGLWLCSDWLPHQRHVDTGPDGAACGAGAACAGGTPAALPCCPALLSAGLLWAVLVIALQWCGCAVLSDGASRASGCTQPCVAAVQTPVAHPCYLPAHANAHAHAYPHATRLLSLQVFIGSALVPYFSKVTKRYREAQKVAAEEAAVADAAGKLEGGGSGGGDDGGSKRGLALPSAAVAADGSSEGKEPPSSQPSSAEPGSKSLWAEAPHSPSIQQQQ